MAQTRQTVQKEIIRNAVANMHNHPTAEAVYEAVATRHPRISKATVYRNLNQMAQDGAILRVPVPNGADCFDFNIRKHYHIRCEVCSCIFDAEAPYREELDHLPRQSSGCEITGHSILFYGVCPQCKAAGSQS